jgi:hypothetical protein
VEVYADHHRTTKIQPPDNDQYQELKFYYVLRLLHVLLIYIENKAKMLPFHRKEKVEDVNPDAFPYRFPKPAMMLSRTRTRLAPRQIQIGGFILLSFLLWLIFRSGERINRHKSPYAATSYYLGDEAILPVVDLTVEECTRWRWFEKRSKCFRMIEEGWEVAGGDLLLDTGKYRTHLFIKREALSGPSPSIVDIQIGDEHPRSPGTWESRPGGIWISRRPVNTVEDAVTAVDYIHGRNIRELRRGREFVRGGQLHLGQDVNLSYRRGFPPPREIPPLKISNNKPYKVLQIAGKAPERPSNIRYASFYWRWGVSRCRIQTT